MQIRERLKALLAGVEATEGLIVRARGAVANDSSRVDCTGPVPRGQLLSIYRTRAEIVAEQAGTGQPSVLGMPELVRELEVAELSELQICQVETGVEWFSIFVDPAYRCVVGLVGSNPLSAKGPGEGAQ